MLDPRPPTAAVDLVADDTDRVPLPGHTPRSERAASYTITRLGRVRRSDGLLVVPKERPLSGGEGRSSLFLPIGGGKSTLSLPRAVWKAFGDHRRMPNRALGQWVPWLHPDSPEDPETGVRRCSIFDIYLVQRGEAQRYAMYGVFPEICIPIVPHPHPAQDKT